MVSNILIVCFIVLLFTLNRYKNIKENGKCGKISYHKFDTPIVSRYVSFNVRDIIYECKCGKRQNVKVYAPTDKPFPIETHSVSWKDFSDILEGSKFKIVGHVVMKKKEVEIKN